MENPILLKAIDHAVSVKLQAVDRLAQRLIEPLAKVGSPENLIGKPFEQWTPVDLAMLTRIYGTAEPNQLSNLIFRKTYERVLALEREEIENA